MNKQFSTGNSAVTRRLLLGMLLLATAPSTAHAQQLVVGDMIRVRASSATGMERGWNEARVVRLAPDTLWYQSNGSALARSWDNVELKRPTFGDRRWSGLGIGAVTGGAIGALVALVDFSPENLSLGCAILTLICPEELVLPLVPESSRARETVVGAVTGALIGGGLGYVVGRMLGHWETVELDQVIVGQGGLGLSFSIRP